MRQKIASDLKIPFDELVFITPSSRERLFMDLINEYKTRYPNVKFILAYLNKDASLKVDYLIVFEFKHNTTNELGIGFDIPYIYTKGSIPGYRYCKRENKLNEFFKEANNKITAISYSKFKTYIEGYLELSMKKEDPLYWKSPNNFKKLSDGLIELYIQYNRI